VQISFSQRQHQRTAIGSSIKEQKGKGKEMLMSCSPHESVLPMAIDEPLEGAAAEHTAPVEGTEDRLDSSRAHRHGMADRWSEERPNPRTVINTGRSSN